MKKEFNQEMLNKLNNAWEETKGTNDWYKYLMENTYKHNSKWSFRGNYIPSKTGVFKTFKGITYIYTNSDERYEVNEFVKELLNLN